MESIAVTPDEFEAAAAVWLTIAPRRLFAQLEKDMERYRQKRGPDPLPAFRNALARHCREKLEQAGWVVMRPERGNIFSEMGRI